MFAGHSLLIYFNTVYFLCKMSALDDTERLFQLIIPIPGCLGSSVRSCSYETFVDTEQLATAPYRKWLTLARTKSSNFQGETFMHIL